MITIDQLLESVDLSFEARWITKDNDGGVWAWSGKPNNVVVWGVDYNSKHTGCAIGKIKLAEFDGKHWTECIYEVPQKTTGEIEQILLPALVDEQIEDPSSRDIWIHTIVEKVAELVDAVNKLKGVGE